MLRPDKGWDHDGTTKIYEVYDEDDKFFNDAIYNKLVGLGDEH